MKTCKRCPSTDIEKRGLCIDCLRVVWNESKRLQRYGINAEEYEALLAAQDFKCAGCKRDADTYARAMHVDHDHACCPGKKSCGKCVRGLLCHGCNVTLGFVNDDVNRLTGLVEYLTGANKKEVK